MSVEEWKRWRQDRNEKLREPFGWLSLVSLDWLGPEPQTLQTFPGTWTAHGNAVTWNDQEFQVVPGEAIYVEADGKQAEIALRFGRICVRVRDPRSPVRTDFAGTESYDYADEARVEGEFVAFDEPRSIDVPSAYPGGSINLTAIGELTIPGEAPLLVTEGPSGPHVIFSDPSNELWRSAPVDGNIVDFNRSTFFPASFTPYATCPTPPAQNRLSNPVLAGEKK